MDSFCFFLFVSYMCFERTFKTNDNRSFSFLLFFSLEAVILLN